MKLTDLHVHSSASDGRTPPAKVVQLAAKRGAYAIALTDHDTFAGLPEALAEADRLGTVKVIPGVEISAVCHGREIHLLALNPRWHDPAFAAFVQHIHDSRSRRNDKLLRTMQEAGYDITLSAIQHSPEDSVTRANFARWMVDHRYARSVKEAFAQYFDPGCPFYLPREPVDPVESVRQIVAAGGHAVLAHPLLYTYLTREELLAQIDILVAAGLSGLEVYYSTYTPEETAWAASVAQQKGLFATGGSDFHGSNKPDIALLTGRGNLRYDGEQYPYLEEPIHR